MTRFSWVPSLDFTGRLYNPLPTVSAGISLTAIVFIILTAQVGLYFWKPPIHRRDRPWIKGLVILIWMIQALDVALACHMTAVAHGDFSLQSTEQVMKCLRELATHIGTSATTGCLVHGYFISRIYLLRTKSHHIGLSIMLCIVLSLEGVFGFISFSFFLKSTFEGVDSSAVTNWSIPSWLGSSILADISIAGSLCYILKENGPVRSTRLYLLIKRLMKFAIQTGLITSLVAGITVALWSAAQLDYGHLFMIFPMGGFYATCFMANLIARESYFHHIQVDEEEVCLRVINRSISFATVSL